MGFLKTLNLYIQKLIMKADTPNHHLVLFPPPTHTHTHTVDGMVRFNFSLQSSCNYIEKLFNLKQGHEVVVLSLPQKQATV
jgi:hypothetical protein